MITEEDDPFPLPLHNAIIQLAGREEDLPLKAAIHYVLRLSSLGVRAVSGDVKRFTKVIRIGMHTGDSFRLPVSARRIKSAGLDPATIAKAMSAPITQEEIDSFSEIFTEAMSASVVAIVGAAAKGYVKNLKSEGIEALNEHRAARKRFIAHLRSVWGKPLDQFEMLVHVAREVGNLVIAANDRAKAQDAMALRMEAITLLYGRACQIAGEISVLLAAGFPDGAHGRWRSLHEVQVVMTVISEDGEDLAERYLEHFTIDQFGEADLALKHGGNRISPSITAQEYAEIKEARENLLAKYGADFGAPYGWASKRLGHKATRFSDIEEIAGAKYVRPFYKSASGNVHASSGGTLVRLGQPPDVDGLVTGASAFGLARPAIGAAHSLALAAVSFATMTASPDAMAYAMAMNTFAEETSSAFEVAERRTYGSLGRRSS